VNIYNEEIKDKYILGIDAAWTSKEPSGVAVLKYIKNGKHELVKLARSYEEFIEGDIDWSKDAAGSYPNMKKLLEVCKGKGYNIEVAALDMPLSSTPIIGRRAAEKLRSSAYAKYGAATHSPTLESPCKVSEDIFSQLKANGLDFAYYYKEGAVFIQVYPHSAIIELLKLQKKLMYEVNKSSIYWPEERDKKLINNLNQLRNELSRYVANIDNFLPLLVNSKKYRTKTLKEYEDMLDAIVCGLVGCFYIDGNITVYGDEAGAIWVPKVKKGETKVMVYNKLVRDKIPEVIANTGKGCAVDLVYGKERYKLLENKLKEEVEEFLQDKNLEELADIMEVVFGLAESLGYSEAELMKKRDEKREERGGFKEGVVLLKVYEGDN
jgi:predicted house-cleaning noncanonical NTP pyrophosphatase (MazG superfamily)/predicted RNase H-like nuclease